MKSDAQDPVSFDYRSLNKRPTALGIDRKLCVVGVMLAAIRFHLPFGHPVIESVGLFAGYWCVIYFLCKWEPRILKILPDLLRQGRTYSARKVN